MKCFTYTIIPHKTGLRLLGVARNPANGFPARLLARRFLNYQLRFLHPIIDKRVKAILSVVIVLLTAIAAVITIGQFVLHWWDLPFAGGSTSVPPAPASAPPQRQRESPVPIAVPILVPTATPTVGPTTTPTPVAHLNKQLEEALSVSTSSAKNKALLIVAQDAVLKKDYWTAIRAASATPYSSAQAKNLGFVVRCAIEDGLYDFAAEAANEMKYTSDRDRLKLDVIEARRRATSKVEPLEGDREAMACFSQ